MNLRICEFDVVVESSLDLSLFKAAHLLDYVVLVNAKFGQIEKNHTITGPHQNALFVSQDNNFID